MHDNRTQNLTAPFPPTTLGYPQIGKKYLAPQIWKLLLFHKDTQEGTAKKGERKSFDPFPIEKWASKLVPLYVYYRAFSYNFFTRMPEVYWFCSFLFQLIVLWLEFADIELFEWVYEERRRMTLFDERRHQKAASQIRFTLIEQFMHSKKGFQLRTYFCNFLNFFFFFVKVIKVKCNCEVTLSFINATQVFIIAVFSWFSLNTYLRRAYNYLVFFYMEKDRSFCNSSTFAFLKTTPNFKKEKKNPFQF